MQSWRVFLFFTLAAAVGTTYAVPFNDGVPVNCSPGTIFKRDCNFCRCGENGVATCTQMTCDTYTITELVQKPTIIEPVQKPILVNGATTGNIACKPGTIFKIYCNFCRCNFNGVAICSNITCGGYDGRNEVTFIENTGSKGTGFAGFGISLAGLGAGFTGLGSQGAGFGVQSSHGVGFTGLGSQGAGFGGQSSQGAGFGGQSSQGAGFGVQSSQSAGFGGQSSQSAGFGGQSSQGAGFGGQSSQGAGFGGQSSQGAGFGGQGSQGAGFGGQGSQGVGFGGQSSQGAGFGGQSSQGAGFGGQGSQGVGFGGQSSGSIQENSGAGSTFVTEKLKKEVTTFFEALRDVYPEILRSHFMDLFKRDGFPVAEGVEYLLLYLRVSRSLVYLKMHDINKYGKKNNLSASARINLRKLLTMRDGINIIIKTFLNKDVKASVFFQYVKTRYLAIQWVNK